MIMIDFIVANTKKNLLTGASYIFKLMAEFTVIYWILFQLNMLH